MPLPSGWNASGMNACKPLRLVLQRAQAQHVIDAMLERLDVPVEHRRVRAHAHAVRDAVHLEVLVGGRLVVRDARAHVRVEDLGAAAGQAVEPRRAQPLEHLVVGHPVVLREEVDLDRREALEVHVGLDALEAAKQLLVVRERQARDAGR